MAPALDDAYHPIAIYLELYDNQKADLEAVSRASIAFVAAVKESGYLVDPTITVRVELNSGTESSLILNTVIKLLGIEEKFKKASYATIIGVVSCWVATDLRQYVFDHVLDHLVTSGQVSPEAEDANIIADKVCGLLKNKVSAKCVQDFYRALETDPSIKGVGISQQHGKIPNNVVPRSQFKSRSRDEEPQVEGKRFKDDRETLVLISPVLIDDPQRRWKFKGKEGEFGASIKDAVFLHSVLRGQAGIQMVSGVELDVEIRTFYKFTENVWQPSDRVILQVYGHKQPKTQETLDDLLMPRSSPYTD